MTDRLQDLRQQNDATSKAEIETAVIRGKISMLKEILAFADEADAGTDATPDSFGGGTDGHGA